MKPGHRHRGFASAMWCSTPSPSSSPTRVPQSPALRVGVQDRELDSRPNTKNNKSSATSNSGARNANGTALICTKCGEEVTGQFVAPFDGEFAFHPDCFSCQDCGEKVVGYWFASAEFFLPDDGTPEAQCLLCETDYLRRINHICYECGGVLWGPYVSALGRYYHCEHFTCSQCPTVFGPEDGCYEHEGEIYCIDHYLALFAQQCKSCHTAITGHFVGLICEGEEHYWHPECCFQQYEHTAAVIDDQAGN